MFEQPGSLDDCQTRKWYPTSDGEKLERPIDTLQVDKQQKYVALLLQGRKHDSPFPKLLVYNITRIEDDVDSGTMTFPEILAIPATAMLRFLGFYENQVVYLDHRLWIRSIDLTSVVANAAFDSVTSKRYTFVPPEYVSGDHGVHAIVTSIGAVVFPRDGELAVLKNLLQWPFTPETVKFF
jgi:hypothetical protein